MCQIILEDDVTTMMQCAWLSSFISMSFISLNMAAVSQSETGYHGDRSFIGRPRDLQINLNWNVSHLFMFYRNSPETLSEH